MKKKSLIIKVILFIITIFMFSNVNAQTVSLNELYEIRNDAEELETVTHVDIKTSDNLDYTYLLSQLPNLDELYIHYVSFDDFTFINNISHEFYVVASGGLEKYINLNGVNNQYLKGIIISMYSVYNFTGIQNINNLQELELDCIFNYNDIDYSILSELTNLTYLNLSNTGVNNYQQFFNAINQLNNLKELCLSSTNLQNKDIGYLKANQSVERLSLEGTMITDISFLKDMPNIKSVFLPSHVSDFSVLYELDNLIGSDFYHGVFWDDFTQYNVSSDLIEYLDNKGINHTRYYASMKSTIDEIVEDANVLPTDDDRTKVIKVMKALQSFATIDTGGYNQNEDSGGTSLSKIVLLKKGVCDNWSTLTDVLLNIVGVESYKTTGFLAGFSVHAWNVVKIDGKMYALDIMNARPHPTDYFDLSTWDSQTKARMFRDLFRIDSYREIDANNNNLDFNYNFPVKYIETDGFSTTKILYDFEVVEGVLDIAQKNIWIDLNTNVNSLNFVTVSGYIYKYYDSQGNIKNSGIAETGDYIIVTSSNNANYSHKYEIIVEEKTYKIKLESDSFGQNESITVKNGEKYTGLFTPVKFCYRFLGWYTAKTGGILITEDSIVNINEVDTLYAHWEFDNKYIVKVHTTSIYGVAQYIFEPNDYYYNVKSIIDDAARPQLYNANYAVDSDKKFAGFYTEENGGRLVTYHSIVVTNANHDLYAHYVDADATTYSVFVSCFQCDAYSSAQWPIEPGSKIARFYTPRREGYTFKYWAVNGEEYDFDTPVTGNMTISAVWEENPQYTITFNSNGGSSVPSQTVNYNGTATQPSNPTKTGHTFVEWQLNGNTYNFNTPVTGNITLTAVWTINQYTITFNSNGGSNVASQTVNYNGTATQPSNPTKTGHTFVEWQLNGNTYNFNTPVTENITLTVVWQINQYSVSFNSDGGSSVASQTVNYNGTATQPSNPTKTGHTFKEWQLNGNKYNFSTPVTGNITLTAVWTINQYTITFNSNGGSSVATQTVNYNSTATQPSNPTRNGYTFKEWQLNGVAYNFNTPVTSNITLTALWQINQYTVTFNSNGGSSVATQTVNYNSTATQPSNPTRNGYTFKEWQLNGQAYNFSTAVTGNITLNAIWIENVVPQDETLKDILEDNSYNVTSNLVSGFTVGMTVTELKNKLGDSSITVNTNNTIISTGTMIKKGNESYTIVIKGDLTGDGKINSGDLLQMRKYLLEEVNLTGAYKQAGIIESNGEIKSLDLLRLRQYLLDEYVFK